MGVHLCLSLVHMPWSVHMGDDVEGNNEQGSVYVYLRNGNTWSQYAKLIASDGAAYDWFGSSVSISGSYMLVGAKHANIAGISDQGSAYVYHSNVNTWNQLAKLTASDGITDDWFGNSVSISGNYSLVGAIGDDVGGNSNQGSVYFFNQ